MRRMRRASVSNAFLMKSPSLRLRQWWLFFYVIVAACVVLASVAGSATAISHAVEGDENDGSLELNSDVILNESVEVGAAGEFAIRGRLFLEDLTARSEALRAESEQRLRVDETLTFQRREDARIAEYQQLRSGLFETYTPDVAGSVQEEVTDFSMFYGVAIFAGIAVALGGGAFLGTMWAKRKRVSA